VSEQSRLDVLERERFSQERISVEIDLADGEIVRSAPVRVHECDLFCRNALNHRALVVRWIESLFERGPRARRGSYLGKILADTTRDDDLVEVNWV